MCSDFITLLLIFQMRNKLIPQAVPTLFQIPNPPRKVTSLRKLPAKRMLDVEPTKSKQKNC